MSEPLSTEELGAQHSDATDVSNSDVQLPRLTAMKRFAGEGEPCGALFVVRCGEEVLGEYAARYLCDCGEYHDAGKRLCGHGEGA